MLFTVLRTTIREVYSKGSLQKGAFPKFPPSEKHHQRKFLGGVRVFSAKNAEESLLFCYKNYLYIGP
jgi:hypothetical protein